MQIKQDSKLSKLKAFAVDKNSTLQLKGGSILSDWHGNAAIIVEM